MGKVEVEVELDDETQAILDEEMETGEYGSPSEVVEEALSLMMAERGYGSALIVPEHALNRRLGFWLNQIKEKRKTLTITRDGNVVAEMKPASRVTDLEARLERLERALELGARNKMETAADAGEAAEKSDSKKRRRKRK